MALRLILVRHAKSSWGDARQDDHDRPLSDRGQRSAHAVGSWLAENDFLPDLVLSSDSARTRETWTLMAERMPGAPRVEWQSALYHAPAQVILDVLRQRGKGRTVLLLGHNPGIGSFANMIVAAPARHPRFRDYPTAATTVIDFEENAWADIDWDHGEAVDFVVPRELTV